MQRLISSVTLVVVVVLILLALFSLNALKAEAHTDAELRDWQTSWQAEVNAYGPSPRLMSEYYDMVERHPCRLVECTQPVELTPEAAHYAPIPAPSVEMWRGLVEAHFGANTEAALRVMACESVGDPDAYNRSSGASGLFQFLPSTWRRTMGEDYPGGVFDGNRNIEAAAKLSKGGTDWSQWSCKP